MSDREQGQNATADQLRAQAEARVQALDAARGTTAATGGAGGAGAVGWALLLLAAVLLAGRWGLGWAFPDWRWFKWALIALFVAAYALGVRGRAGRLCLLAVAGLMGVAWAGTFGDMWLRWFPEWYRPGMALMDRLTKGDSYYTHGPLVPLTSLVIAFFIHRRVGLPRQRSRSATVAGAAILGVFLAFHLTSVLARVMFVSGFALLGVLIGLLLLTGGWPLLRAYWLPVAVLLFMVPLPEVAVADLNYRLKFFAGRAAVWATNNIFQVPALMDGSYVHLLPAADGTPKTLRVENVCGGLRSLISLTFFAALFAAVCRVRGFWRVVMLLMAVPVAVASNVVRITGLNVVAHHYGVENAAPGSAFHDWSGILVFAVALAILFGLEQAIVLSGRLLKRSWTDARLLGFLDHLPRGAEGARPALRPAAVGALALAAVLSLVWMAQAVAANRSNLAAGAVSKELALGDVRFRSQDLELDELSLAILETRDYLCRRFTAGAQKQAFDLLIVFSPDNRKGTHPPDVCLEGSGEETISKQVVSVAPEGMRRFQMKELLTQHGTRLSYHLYVYKCGRRYTPSFFWQQFTIFTNGLLARNSAGALIHFTVPIAGTDPQPARELALAAARQVMPQIDRGLP